MPIDPERRGGPSPKRATKVGTIALRDAAVADKIDYVDRHFQQFEARLQVVFNKTSVAAEWKEDLTRYSEGVANYRLFSQPVFGKDGKLAGDLLDPDNLNTPIGKLRKSIGSSGP